MKRRSVQTRFGSLVVTEEQDAVTRLEWDDGTAYHDVSAVLDEAVVQLLGYDAGTLTAFALPMRIGGSETLRAVCAEISAIPFGDTLTYGDIARKLGVPAQVVGQACGLNPIPVIVPCHRVMGAKGLTGYSGVGGIETKVALLRHEGAAGILI